MGQVWYLIVLFPDLCRLSFFDCNSRSGERLYMYLHFIFDLYHANEVMGFHKFDFILLMTVMTFHSFDWFTFIIFRKQEWYCRANQK